ncbi:response regulator transcription factor [Amycolatopsis sp. NPDC004772]
MLIVIADDEDAVCDSLSRTLRFEGYAVEVAKDGQAALDVIREREPDGVILDVTMPVLDGLETCRRLRAAGNLVPVLMLTARGDVTARVAGLDAGADDYLAKPFSLQELLARVRALLRRARYEAVPEAPADLRFGDLALNPATREVVRAGRPVRLTRTEFAILELFLRHPRQVLTRTVLFEHVWGFDFGNSSNSLDVYLGYLRKKLEAEGAARLLHTVRGVGYVLREDPL